MSTTTLLSQLLKSQRAAVWYVLLVILLPLITLVVLGLIMLWQNNWLIVVSLTWLIATLTGYALYRLWPATVPDKKTAYSSTTASTLPPPPGAPITKTSDLHTDENLQANLPLRLDPRADWTPLDNRVWLRAVEAVELTLSKQPQWTELPEVSLALLTSVSEYYNAENLLLIEKTPNRKTDKPGRIYSFTLPEVLLVLSVTSNRYRQVILDYVPFADKVKVSSLLSLYARQGQIKTGAKWINTIRRTTRFVNPLAAITAELRDQFTNRIFTNLSDKVQNDLKRLLLQELVQVGMDLYSGRLKSTTEELFNYQSQSYSQDADNRVIPVEPLRVVLAGQVSSGKSSLVNALINRLEAETDILPSTNRTTVHSLHWDNAELNKCDGDTPPEPLHLIDTIGLSDTLDTLDSLVDIALQADLLIWIARANQPARAADVAFYRTLQDALVKQPMRRPPPLLLVLTHIDQLKPKAIWQPPYDLNSDVAKASNIRKSIESCKQQIGFPDDTPVIPVCLATSPGLYNVDMVETQIMLLQEEATQTQLNRRRTEQDSNSSSWFDRWNQASKLGTVSGKILLRSVLGD